MDPGAQILQLNCPDRVGLLARITGCVAAHGGNLLEVNQYTDLASGWFFARLAVAGVAFGGGEFRREFGALAEEIGGEWSMRPAGYRAPTAIFVSRQDHCLADLLWRWRSGELPADLRAVVSNHEACRDLAEREGLPFHVFDFAADKKESAFEEVCAVLDTLGVELVVLARFMQILPGWMCDRYASRAINIHHSFLPAFVGANPYRRAFERGVKLIGATCHYATGDLDAGPIIEQQVSRVEHYHDPDDLARLGRDCERIALARGLRYHLEGRVLVHGNRAIVFRD